MVTEKLIESMQNAMPISQAAQYIPGRPHIATIWRWTSKGVRGCKLKTVRIGGRTMVTLADIEDFLNRLNSSATSDIPQITPCQRQQQSEAARKELEKMGIGTSYR